jgi:hypothetical protein
MMGSPPPPKPTDWKGLFDSDSQPNNVAPSAESAAAVLGREPSCTRAITVGSGAFSGKDRDENAWLLACGAQQRLVIANEKATVLSLDVGEDTLITAGDMNFDGDQELLLIAHAGPRVSVRVLGVDAGKLTSLYTFAVRPDPCAHTIIYYRLMKTGLEFREETLPKRCTP